jgi:hypothetical protein
LRILGRLNPKLGKNLRQSIREDKQYQEVRHRCLYLNFTKDTFAVLGYLRDRQAQADPGSSAFGIPRPKKSRLT